MESFAHGFFERGAEEVARELLGARIVSTIGGDRTAGVVIETEAYLGPHDPACHAAERIGRTSRNEAMFGSPGTAYVYLIYGIHWCLNVVTAPVGYPAAVLIRALEPAEGQGVMEVRRGGAGKELCTGPGRLCQALGVTGALDRHDLADPPLVLLPPPPGPPAEVQLSGRIGVRQASDWPLRFCLLRDGRG